MSMTDPVYTNALSKALAHQRNALADEAAVAVAMLAQKDEQIKALSAELKEAEAAAARQTAEIADLRARLDTAAISSLEPAADPA